MGQNLVLVVLVIAVVVLIVKTFVMPEQPAKPTIILVLVLLLVGMVLGAAPSTVKFCRKPREIVGAVDVPERPPPTEKLKKKPEPLLGDD